MSTNAFYLQSSTSSSFTKNALVIKRIRCWCGRKTPLFLQRIKVYARLLKTGLIHLLAVLRKRALFRENQSKRKLNNKKESRSALMLRVRIYLWSKYTDQSLNDDARQFLEKKSDIACIYVLRRVCLVKWGHGLHRDELAYMSKLLVRHNKNVCSLKDNFCLKSALQNDDDNEGSSWIFLAKILYLVGLLIK